MNTFSKLYLALLGLFPWEYVPTVPCEVLDLSLSGLSLKTAVKPLIGEVITIGHVSGRVVRHHETGVALEFCSEPPHKPERPKLRKLGS